VARDGVGGRELVNMPS